MTKKKIVGVSIGVVALIVVIIGVVVFQKQASEKKKIEEAQSQIASIEKETKKDGDLYKEIASLYSENQDFLAEKIDLEAIETAEESLSKKQVEVDALKKKYGSDIDADTAELYIKKLQQKIALANDKLAVQTDVNKLFSSKESAIDGETIQKQLPITTELTKEDISDVSERIEANKELQGDWKEAIDSIIKNATNQVDQVEKIKKMIAEAFDGNVPKDTVKQSDYDSLNKEIAKVRNEELKIAFTSKLILMKTMIDTKSQLDSLSKQQKEAEEEAAKAVEEAANAAQQAVEGAVNAAAEQASKADDILAGYSDDQIEYARVWLAKFGTKPSELNATRIAAGTPINPYNASSMTYPTEVIMLSGGFTAEGSIVYASNHNGTVTIYSVPGHWPAASAADPEVSMTLTQEILDNAQVMSVPAGNPNDVRDLILIQR